MSKKGENIYRRKDGRWEGRYIKFYTQDNKAKYGYCYGRTYHEVKEKLGIAKAAILNNTPIKTEQYRRKLDSYCDEWLTLKRTKVKDSTYIKYHTIIEKHIKPGLGYQYVNKLSTLLVEEFTYNMLHVEMLSSKTVKDILTVLNSIFKYVERECSNFRKIEIIYPKMDKKEMRVLTRDEQKVLTNFLLKDMDECKFGILFTLLTGLRIGEICALKWKDISLDDGLLYVKSTMQRIKNIDNTDISKTKIIISDPKSFSSTRIIPLSPFALELCKKFYSNPNSYVLTGDIHSYMEPRTMQYRIKQYSLECGLTNVHFHTLRHSFATRCVEVGFEIKSLSEVLGHASPQITLERYVHSSIELKRENMNKLTIIGY